MPSNRPPPPARRRCRRSRPPRSHGSRAARCPGWRAGGGRPDRWRCSSPLGRRGSHRPPRPPAAGRSATAVDRRRLLRRLVGCRRRLLMRLHRPTGRWVGLGGAPGVLVQRDTGRAGLGQRRHRLEGDRRSQDRVLRRSLGGRTGRGRSCRSTGTCRCGSWLPAPSKSDRSLVGARTGPAANNSSRPGWVSQGRPRRRAGRTHYGGAESGEAPAVDGRLTRVAESTANASTVIHSFIRPGSASPQSTSSWPCPAPTLR